MTSYITRRYPPLFQIKLKSFCFWRRVLIVTFFFVMPLYAQTQNATRIKNFDVGFINSFLFSQEYMKYFFADYDSPIRPIPANVFAITGSYLINPSFLFNTSLAIPTREEIVKKENGEVWTYYYPKSLNFAVEGNLFTVKVYDETPVQHWVGLSFNTPLSKRFGRVVFPGITGRIRVGISERAGMTLGLGYIGNLRRGLWLIPFGFTNYL